MKFLFLKYFAGQERVFFFRFKRRKTADVLKLFDQLKKESLDNDRQDKVDQILQAEIRILKWVLGYRDVNNP